MLLATMVAFKKRRELWREEVGKRDLRLISI